MLILIRTNSTRQTSKGTLRRLLAVLPSGPQGVTVLGGIEDCLDENPVPPGAHTFYMAYGDGAVPCLTKTDGDNVWSIRPASYAETLGSDIALGTPSEAGLIDSEHAIDALWSPATPFTPGGPYEVRVSDPTLLHQEAIASAAGITSVVPEVIDQERITPERKRRK